MTEKNRAASSEAIRALGIGAVRMSMHKKRRISPGDAETAGAGKVTENSIDIIHGSEEQWKKRGCEAPSAGKAVGAGVTGLFPRTVSPR